MELYLIDRTIHAVAEDTFPSSSAHRPSAAGACSELLGLDLLLRASTSLVCQITLELVEPLAVLYQFAHGGAE